VQQKRILEAGVRRCMRLGSTRICIFLIIHGVKGAEGLDMMIDDDTLKELLKIDDELIQLASG
jgi:hypothetical protein